MDFPLDMDHLYDMLGFIRTAAQKTGMSPEALHRIELMAEEALVNIISYAFTNEHKPHHTVSITCEKTPDGHFQVTLLDEGRPFNPLDMEEPKEIYQAVEERKIGGLGVYMIRRLADKLSYEREGEKNILTMGVRLA